MKIPKTLEEAVQFIIDVNIKELDKLAKEDMSKYHFSTGMNIRNAWGLWDKNSVLHKHFKERFGLSHADDISGLIFHCFHQSINGRHWETKKEVEKYRRHWESFGYEIDGETKKENKLNLTNSYLKAKDFGEKE